VVWGGPKRVYPLRLARHKARSYSLTLELDYPNGKQFDGCSPIERPSQMTDSAKGRQSGRGSEQITLMSVRLDNLSEEEAAEYVVSAAERGEGGQLVNPNVDVMRQVATDRSLLPLLEGADLVLPDGMPLLWAARLQGSPLKERVPVSEAINTLCVKASEKGIGVFLLGGAPGTAERAAEVLMDRSPALSVSYLCPPFGFEDDELEMAGIVSALERDQPGIVFCAFGFPKQERLMHILSDRFPAAWFVGSGGTFSMIAGDMPKAPPWMRNNGLEWLHRLRLEPGRLFERYIVHDLPFACRMLASSAAARVVGSRTGRNAAIAEEPSS
jgi:N-acetylglucosaminyldiphosphoundecaprenol N-acetyl-beta-D-mannosaminyltransferase